MGMFVEVKSENSVAKMDETWQIAQEGEREWWGKVANTYFEQEKQLKYAAKMGLEKSPTPETPYSYDMEGKRILDIGGGPVSMLLLCRNVHGVVADPLRFPPWVLARYAEAGIEYRQCKGEDIDFTGFDEVWIYNVLQHVENPEKVIHNARIAGKLIRIFEWVDTSPNPMHPHKLTKKDLDRWLGGKGTVETTEGGRYPAKMYFGQFSGEPDSSFVGKESEMNVHFVTTGPDFPYIYYLGILTAMKVYGDKVRLWYTEEPKSVYFDRLRGEVRMEKVEDIPDFPALENETPHFQRVAIFDYVVWNAAYKYGGIIMGLDSLTLRSHFDLLHPDKEILAPIDSPGTLYVGMHGVIVRKGSSLARTVIDKAMDSLTDPDNKLEWGDSGMTPYVHSIPSNLDRISLAPYKMVCGRHEDLFSETGSMPHADTRTIPLYSSSIEPGVEIDEEFIAKSNSPYARIVRSMLSSDAKVKSKPVGIECPHAVGGPGTPGPSGVEEYRPIGKVIRPKRFHLLALPHVAANDEALACAFSQKVVKMGMMLKSLGHTVYAYGVEGSVIPCDEFIEVSTQDILNQTYGDYDMKKVTFKHAQDDLACNTFNENAIIGIKERMQPNDFLLIPFSPMRYKMILDALDTPYVDKVDKLHLVVEMGIGYRGTACRYKVFESISQMHLNYGLSNAKNMGAGLNGNWYDAVIPNYFNPDDFEFSDKKKDFFLFLGRVIHRKGVTEAIRTVEAIGAKLIIAGQDGEEGVNLESPNVEYVGFADLQKRKELLRDAKALFLPTLYIEPFGGVIIEAALSGTPVITSDWGAFPELVDHGTTGYRCHTLDHLVWAALNIGNIKPIDCYNYAIHNFSLDRVRWMYDEYFDMLLDVKENIDDQGWSRLHPGRTQLDWLRKIR